MIVDHFCFLAFFVADHQYHRVTDQDHNAYHLEFHIVVYQRLLFKEHALQHFVSQALGFFQRVAGIQEILCEHRDPVRAYGIIGVDIAQHVSPDL